MGRRTELLADLTAISEKAGDLDVTSDGAHFDIGWTTDDLLTRADPPESRGERDGPV